MTVRVLLFHRAEDAADAPAIEAAYHRVSQTLAPVPGLLGNELLRGVHDPNGFVVVSTWRDLAAFTAWEQGAGHRDATAPLRPYRDTAGGRPFGVYQVTAEHGGDQ